MITTKKLIMFMAVGALSGVVIFNALKSHKKTVDDYVNCFKSAKIEHILIEKPKTLTNFSVFFNKYIVSEKEAQEFFEKVGYKLEGLSSSDTSKYLIAEMYVQKIEDPDYLSRKLHYCFMNGVEGTNFGYLEDKNLKLY